MPFTERHNMSRQEVISAYLDALAKGDDIGILKLFADDARITSPLYGELAAADFYRQLFQDTASSQIRLKDIFANVTDPDQYAAHFVYDWTLKNGEQVSFRCMDIFRFKKDSNKIHHLVIIYDSSRTRDAFTRQSSV